MILLLLFSRYRFGIRSCLARNQNQTLNDAIQHDVIVHFGFPGNTTGYPPTRANFIHPLFTSTLANRLANRKVFPRQITARCKYNSAQFDTDGWKSLPWKIHYRPLASGFSWKTANRSLQLRVCSLTLPRFQILARRSVQFSSVHFIFI